MGDLGAAGFNQPQSRRLVIWLKETVVGVKRRLMGKRLYGSKPIDGANPVNVAN